MQQSTTRLFLTAGSQGQRAEPEPEGQGAKHNATIQQQIIFNCWEQREWRAKGVEGQGSGGMILALQAKCCIWSQLLGAKSCIWSL